MPPREEREPACESVREAVDAGPGAKSPNQNHRGIATEAGSGWAGLSSGHEAFPPNFWGAVKYRRAMELDASGA
jgi:hypothetical protein